MSPSPIHPSDIIFPSHHNAITTTLSSLKKSHLSGSNRLHSIHLDSQFVSKVAEAYQLPLVANERCGSWYLHPDEKAGSAYFKSTDGHFGEWNFSLRRLNLQVLEVIGKSGGCIIVDSTRKGKSMPDALSKTIPIWISVLNSLLFPDNLAAAKLRTPEDVVSRSEHTQIEARIPLFVAGAESLKLDLSHLRDLLGGKPMEPVWITPDSILPETSFERNDRNLVILCTASGRTSSERSMSEYVQGAADDSEAWARGLDAETFWQNHQLLLETNEEELPEVIRSLMEQPSSQGNIRDPVLIKPTAGIFVSNNVAAELQFEDFDFVISCAEKPNLTVQAKLKDRYVHLACTAGKVGSRQLRSELPKVRSLIMRLGPQSRILVACQTGKDLAVGVALAVISLACSESGNLMASQSAGAEKMITKASIKHRLSWIMISMPDAKPSRATLQSVNAFLLG